MKKLLGALLVLFLALPAITVLMPHEVLQVLHTQKENHHSIPIEHADQDLHVSGTFDHVIHLDVASFFNDYLHVDLKNTDSGTVNISAQDTVHFDYFIPAENIAFSIYPSNVNSTGPPEYRDYIPYSAQSIYLTTQRIRI